MVKKRLDIGLHDEEMDFIIWMANRDGMTVQEELRSMFYTELRHCFDLYNDERLMENGR